MSKYAVLVLSFAAVAQSLSSTCTSSFTSAATGPAGQCLNVAGLVPLATLSANSSIIAPIDSWLSTMCGSDPCTNDTIASVVSSVTSGCSSDISAAGIDSAALSSLPAYIEQYYATGRQVVCLRDTKANNALCVTTILQQIESALGAPLSTSSITTRLPALLATNDTLTKAISCSQCAQAAFAVISPSFPSDVASSTKQYFTSTCGDSFVSSGEPANIIVATGSLAGATPTASQKSGSRLSISAQTVMLPMTFGLSGVMAFMWTLM